MKEGTPPAARVCVLTAEGRGAVAVVRVWGPEALVVADAAFRPARGLRLVESPAGRLRLGRIGAGLGDEVVAVVLDGEPPEVEIQCHGGPAPLALVVTALTAAGAEPAAPEDWAGHVTGSITEAEAALDLAHAPTIRTAEILLDQQHGALAAEVRQAIQLAPAEPARAGAILDALLDRSAVGLRLISGWRVVLAGRPNVGKSQLLNAIAGYERAIVDPTPGTTRDVVTVRTAVTGWPIELADTAGLRESSDPIESSGVMLARSRQAAADLVLLVLDRSEPLTAADRIALATLPAALVVANKSDLPAAWESPAGPLAVSALEGTGIESVLSALASRLVPEPPPPGAGVPFRPRQVNRLRRARLLLASGRIDGAIRGLRGLLRPSG